MRSSRWWGRSLIGVGAAVLAAWGPGALAAGAADAPLDPPQLVFFEATDGSTRGLWRTNGTGAGTRLVMESDNASAFRNGASSGGVLYFDADDGEHGSELWRSDGTVAGTYMLKDIRPTGSSGPNGLVTTRDGVCFIANDGAHGREVWCSDGTADGTRRVTDLPGTDYMYGPSALTHAGDELFFVLGNNLWVVDEADPAPGIGARALRAGDYQYPEQLTGSGGRLFMINRDSEVWVSDGTTDGTELVADLRGPNRRSAWINYVTAFDGGIVFRAKDGVHGLEPWRSDGTAAGTRMIDDVNPTGQSEAWLFTALDDTVFFNARDGVHGRELWRSDGTEAGTRMVKDIKPHLHSMPLMQAQSGDMLFFSAGDGVHGRQLWRTDGTEAGTRMVKDLNPVGRTDPGYVAGIGDVRLFTARDGVHGREIWRTDGTPAGTSLVIDLNPGGARSIAEPYQQGTLVTLRR